MEFLDCRGINGLKGKKMASSIVNVGPELVPQAPAKKFAEMGDALQEELGSGTSALHHSTRSVVKGTLKNASRQYQRAARRFKMAMPPDLSLAKLCMYSWRVHMEPGKH